MKTIMVVYTDVKLTKSEAQTMKRYSFNTKSKVKVGDLFSLPAYTTAMQVVEVLDACYKYIDIGSGELSNKKKASTKQYEVREIEVSTSRFKADSEYRGELINET